MYICLSCTHLHMYLVINMWRCTYNMNIHTCTKSQGCIKHKKEYRNKVWHLVMISTLAKTLISHSYTVNSVLWWLWINDKYCAVPNEDKEACKDLCEYIYAFISTFKIFLSFKFYTRCPDTTGIWTKTSCLVGASYKHLPPSLVAWP